MKARLFILCATLMLGCKSKPAPEVRADVVPDAAVPAIAAASPELRASASFALDGQPAMLEPAALDPNGFASPVRSPVGSWSRGVLTLLIYGDNVDLPSVGDLRIETDVPELAPGRYAARMQLALPAGEDGKPGAVLRSATPGVLIISQVHEQKAELSARRGWRIDGSFEGELQPKKGSKERALKLSDGKLSAVLVTDGSR